MIITHSVSGVCASIVRQKSVSCPPCKVVWQALVNSMSYNARGEITRLVTHRWGGTRVSGRKRVAAIAGLAFLFLALNAFAQAGLRAWIARRLATDVARATAIVKAGLAQPTLTAANAAARVSGIGSLLRLEDFEVIVHSSRPLAPTIHRGTVFAHVFAHVPLITGIFPQPTWLPRDRWTTSIQFRQGATTVAHVTYVLRDTHLLAIFWRGTAAELLLSLVLVVAGVASLQPARLQRQRLWAERRVAERSIVHWLDRVMAGEAPEDAPFAPDLDAAARRFRRTWEHLHGQLEMLSACAQGASIGIAFLDARLIVRQANSALCETIGIRQADVTEAPVSELIRQLPELHGTASTALLNLTRAARRSAFPCRTEITTGDTTGCGQRALSVSLSCIRSGRGAIVGYVALVHDCTALQLFEQRREHLDRLNLIAEFAASTTHEIRNPLTTVRGFLQLQLKRGGTAVEGRHVQIMIEEIDRVDQLITEYLTLARHNSVETRRPLPIDAVLREFLPLVVAEGNMRGIEVRLQRLDSGYVRATKQELKQVCLNIIKNALDATPVGGTVTITGVAEPQGYVISFADTGKGIDEALASHIFEPFFTTKAHGSGLGLAVCAQIVQTLGGDIAIASEAGCGATFHVGLPVISIQAADPAATAGSADVPRYPEEAPVFTQFC
jgi:two-component system, sporulation sensor kinase E